MQEFLRATLVEMTAKPSPEEWVSRVERRLAAFEGPGPTAEEIVADLRELRDSR